MEQRIVGRKVKCLIPLCDNTNFCHKVITLLQHLICISQADGYRKGIFQILVDGLKTMWCLISWNGFPFIQRYLGSTEEHTHVPNIGQDLPILKKSDCCFSELKIELHILYFYLLNRTILLVDYRHIEPQTRAQVVELLLQIPIGKGQTKGKDQTPTQISSNSPGLSCVSHSYVSPLVIPSTRTSICFCNCSDLILEEGNSSAAVWPL